MIEPGEVLNNRYKILHFSHKGTYKNIYKAEDQLENTFVAVKEIDLSGLRIREAAELKTGFREEINYLKNLNHPTLVKFIDSFSIDTVFYYVVEWVDGMDLKTALAKMNKPFKGKEVANLFYAIADFFDYTHIQDPPYYMRLLKPSDIMVAEGGIVKIVDLGMDLEVDVNSTPPGYIVPDDEPGDKRDVFILGTLIFELVTKQEPGTYATNPFPETKDLNKEVNKAFSDILAMCLVEKRSKTISVKELKNDLMRWFPEFISRDQTTPEAVTEDLKEKEQSVLMSKLGCYGCFTFIITAIILTFMYLPGFIINWNISRLDQCSSNVDKLANSINNYYSDYKKYPARLDDLIPRYLDEFPSCPVTGDSKPYIEAYEHNDVGGIFTICCSGHFHKNAGAPENYPTYSKKWGLKKKP
ncbi:MAG: protein kinase [Firmicutes bacterium]|nr:protein kinase [Bacillota bacterium]